MARIGYWEYDLTSKEEHFWSEEMFGILRMSKTKQTPTPDDFYAKIHPEDLTKVVDIVTGAEKLSDELVNIEFRILTQAEDVKYLEAKCCAVRNAADEIIRVEGTLQDITKRKESEHALYETQSNLNKAYKVAGIGTFKYSIKSDQYHWTETALDVIGLDEKSVPKTWKEFKKLFPREDQKKAETEIVKAIKTGEFDLEHRLIINGKVKWVREFTHIEYDTNGKPDYVTGVIQNVTRDRKIKEEISENESKLSISSELAKVGYWEYDLLSREFTISDELYRMYKTSFDEEGTYKLSESEYLRRFLFEEDRDRLKRIIKMATKLKQQAGPQYLEHPIRYKDGKPGFVAVRTLPLTNDEGEIERFIGANQDITEQRQNQIELEKMLEEKVTLVMEVHHRVKNNLAIISGLLQLQAMQSNDENLSSKLMESTLRISSIAMVHELLYKSEHLSSINISDYLERLIPHVKNSLEREHLNVTIHTYIEDLELNINQAVPLGLMLNELITNSFKYAFVNRETGSIEVSFYQKGRKFFFDYQDDGIGLPDDVDFNNPERMGLTLVQSQLEQMEAEYQSESKEGFRLSFSFKLKQKGSQSMS